MKNNECGLICKFDIKKVYDHVNWGFLLSILKKMSFGEKWVNWIKLCTSTIRYFILFKAISLDFFQSSQGLR